jgi:hypothetical protein
MNSEYAFSFETIRIEMSFFHNTIRKMTLSTN